MSHNGSHNGGASSSSKKKKKGKKVAPHPNASTKVVNGGSDDQFESLPARIRDEEEWEVVVDKKALSRQERQKKKEQEEQAKEAASASSKSVHTTSNHVASSSNSRGKDAPSKEASRASSGQLKSAPPRRKRKKESNSNYPKPQNSKDMTALVRSLLEGSPVSYMQLSALSNHLQTVTNCSWNKTFKPKFGSLKTFLDNTAAFHYDQDLDRVFLVEEFHKVESLAKRAEKKKQQREAIAEAKQKAAEAQVEEEEAVEDAGLSTCMRASAVTIGVTASIFIGMMVWQGDLGAIIARAQELIA